MTVTAGVFLSRTHPREGNKNKKCGTVVPQQVDISVRCGCGETHRGGGRLCGVSTLSGVSKEDSPRVPRGAWRALKGYSDIEAVRSRGQYLVINTILILFSA